MAVSVVPHPGWSRFDHSALLAKEALFLHDDGMPTIDVIRAGVVHYPQSLAWQERLVEERSAGAPDRLILLQHPPVITLGRGADRDHVVAPPHALAARQVEVCETPRGGDVTFHGPGQLVAYPILALPRPRQDVRRYVHDLEEVVIRTVSDFGASAERVEGLRGVFVGRDKVAAVGVRIWRWITSHGLALNVNPDLSYYDLIIPCGITDRGVTSLARLRGAPPPMAEVEARLLGHFVEVFGFTDIRERAYDR